MSQHRVAMQPESIDPGARLQSGYCELTRVDQALRDAEQRLYQAHVECSRQRKGPQRAGELFREVQSLRDRSRRVLASLGEIWVAET